MMKGKEIRSDGVFSKDQIITCMYIFTCFVCHTVLLHPRSLPFSTRGAKSLCAEFNLNILYLIKIMLDSFFLFFLQKHR